MTSELADALVDLEDQYSSSNYAVLNTKCDELIDTDPSGCALFWKGVLYRQSWIGAPGDESTMASEHFTRARVLLARACEDGCGNPTVQGLAETSLAWMYTHGITIDRNMELSMKLNLSAADKDIPRALNNLGWIYNEGRYNDIDREAAFKMYIRCANLGYAIGQYSLGRMYDFGEGIPVNKTLAAEWYQKSADQGNLEGLNNLALLYEEGVGVEKNLHLAFQYYSAAVGKGSTVASLNLGYLYWMGKVPDVDGNDSMRLAAVHVSRAAEKNHPQALSAMGQICWERDEIAEALQYYLRANGLEHSNRISNLLRITIETEEACC
jgi:TPR repeat protein